MASGLSPFIGLFVVGIFCAASYVYAPKGPYQVVWRWSLLLTAACCYLMWVITFLAQLNPLVAPMHSNLRPEYVGH